MGFWEQVIKSKVLKVKSVKFINTSIIDNETSKLLLAQITPKSLTYSKDLCDIEPKYTNDVIRVPFKEIDEDGFYTYFNSQFYVRINKELEIASIDIYAVELTSRQKVFQLLINT